MKQSMSEFDIFYISFDEPNAEEHWANLLNVAPWAKRVHGVKGFDAAHKECARQSETSKFITVDGDNVVDPSFLELVVDIPEQYDDCILSWASRNHVNGLVYGNGGLKLWPKAQTLEMNTHENAKEERFNLDFCWDRKYIQMNNVYSTTYINGSPFQAFRAGFREGAKMTIDGSTGKKMDPKKLHLIHPKNLKRLQIWMSVGADVENGLWSILGTRVGLYLSNFDDDFDVNKIRDYVWFNDYFSATYSKFTAHDLHTQIDRMGAILRYKTDINFADLDGYQSAFFKSVYEAPKRVDALRTEIEVDNA